MVIAVEQELSKLDLAVGIFDAMALDRISNEDPLSPEEIGVFHQHLIHLREWLIRGIAELEKRSGSIAASARRVSTQGDGENETIWEQALVQQAVADKRLLLHEVMRAFERIRQNTYGRCMANNCCIERNILNEVPWARYCPACAGRHG